MGNNTAKCWMSNLNLGNTDNYPLAVSQLDSTNSNMPTTSAIPAATFNSWKKTSATASDTSPELIPVSGQDSYGNKYGTLYNYAAASAGTYVYASGSGTGDAQYSLCPSGWSLPVGGSSGDYVALTDANSITSDAIGVTKLQSVFGFSLAGNIKGSGDTTAFTGTRGFYWSSSWGNSYSMQIMEVSSSPVYYRASSDGGGYYRQSLNSVRCIKQ